MTVQIVILGTENFHQLSRRLHAAGHGGLVRELRQEIRHEARPTVTDLRATVRALPIQGFPKPGRKTPYTGPSRPKRLRARVAAAIEARVYTGHSPGVTIFVRKSRLGAERRLPDLMDGSPRWRHPVMGNRSVWVRQFAPQWWYPTLRRHLPAFARAVHDAARRVIHQAIEG